MMFSATQGGSLWATIEVFTRAMYVHPCLLLSTCGADLDVFLQPVESFIDDETKLTLHGIQQYYKLKPQKNRKLNKRSTATRCEPSPFRCPLLIR
jgi:hypothetical protein